MSEGDRSEHGANGSEHAPANVTPVVRKPMFLPIKDLAPPGNRASNFSLADGHTSLATHQALKVTQRLCKVGGRCQVPSPRLRVQTLTSREAIDGPRRHDGHRAGGRYRRQVETHGDIVSQSVLRSGTATRVNRGRHPRRKDASRERADRGRHPRFCRCQAASRMWWLQAVCSS